MVPSTKSGIERESNPVLLPDLEPQTETNEQYDSRRRYRGILEAGVSAFISKGAVLVANLLTIPIVVRYLGPVQFGIWATITTSVSLLLVMDLGIANTLTNLISEAYAHADRKLAGTYSATAFWLMIGVASALAVLGWLVWPLVNWNYVFDVKTIARGITSHSVAAAYAVFLLGMPAGLATKLLGGYQELRTANIFAATGSLGSLAAVALVAKIHGGLPMLVGASTGALVFANAACLLWIWFHHKPWLLPLPSRFSVSASRTLLQTGSEFFMIQLAGLIVFNSDNLVIAHYVGPAEVTPYNVTWRLVSYAAALQTLMLPALWPAYSEAFVRGDMPWIRITFRKTMLWTMGLAACLSAVFLLAGRILIRYWAGSMAVPSFALLFWMCVWVMISTFMNNVACILVAVSETRLQAWSSMIGAVLNLGLSIWLVHSLGSLGVILGTVVSYLVALVGPQAWKVQRVLA
jgi:O-antigen/teichoic acid export membrane protein